MEGAPRHSVGNRTSRRISRRSDTHVIRACTFTLKGGQKKGKEDDQTASPSWGLAEAYTRRKPKAVLEKNSQRLATMGGRRHHAGGDFDLCVIAGRCAAVVSPQKEKAGRQRRRHRSLQRRCVQGSEQRRGARPKIRRTGGTPGDRPIEEATHPWARRSVSTGCRVIWTGYLNFRQFQLISKQPNVSKGHFHRAQSRSKLS